MQATEIKFSIVRTQENYVLSNAIEDLINSPESLNYLNSHAEKNSLLPYILDAQKNLTYSVIAWSDESFLGLVGFAFVRATTRALSHFVFADHVEGLGLDHAFAHFLHTSPLGPRLSGESLPVTPAVADNLTFVSEEDEDSQRALAHIFHPDQDWSSPSIRIMANFQSAGIASELVREFHVSTDNWPRAFILSLFDRQGTIPGPWTETMVYGAFSDYGDKYWSEGSSDEEERYARAALKFVTQAAQENSRLLILLPSEQTNGETHSLGNYASKNGVWRRLEGTHPHVTTLTLTLENPTDNPDPRRFSPANAQKMHRDVFHAIKELPVRPPAQKVRNHRSAPATRSGATMNKTVILIRCMTPNDRLRELARQLEAQCPEFSVMAVPDFTQVPESEHQQLAESFGMKVLPLTEAFIEESGLHYYEQRKRTGWACGDYVLYRALEESWDYAWVVEPDVYFLNGAEGVLNALSSVATGLIATHIWPAANDWMWRKQLQVFMPHQQIYAMAFPLLRVSRAVAEEAFALRQSITPQLDDKSKIPNDESIISTVAHIHELGTLDLKKMNRSMFRYWSTANRIPVNDIRQRETGQLIIHSGYEHREFLEHLGELWDALDDGWVNGRLKLLNAFRIASPATQQVFLEQISAKKLAEGQKKKP